MTSATTNYGVTLGKQDSTGYTSIGEIVTVDPPEYMNAEVEATNHGSGGEKEFISGALREMTSFKATVNMVPASMATLVTDLEGGTIGAYQLGYPDGTKQTFGALVTSIKPGTADAQNPEALKAEVTFRPTGTLGLSS